MSKDVQSNDIGGVVEKKVCGQEQEQGRARQASQLQLHAGFTRETQHPSELPSHLTSLSLTRRSFTTPFFAIRTVIQ